MTLEKKHCTPCKIGGTPLTRTEAEKLLDQTPGWELDKSGTQIRCSLKFKNFKAAFDFVKKVSIVAEQEGHHPDVSFGLDYCNLKLYTHKINGLHENDFIVAAKINTLMS